MFNLHLGLAVCELWNPHCGTSYPDSQINNISTRGPSGNVNEVVIMFNQESDKIISFTLTPHRVQSAAENCVHCSLRGIFLRIKQKSKLVFPRTVSFVNSVAVKSIVFQKCNPNFNSNVAAGAAGSAVVASVKKPIAIFTFNSDIVSIDMKTKVVQHVQRINKSI